MNMTMKKIILSLVALLATMSINAQGFEVYKNGALIKTFKNTDENKYKVASDKTASNNYGCFDVYRNGSIVQAFPNDANVKYKIVFVEEPGTSPDETVAVTYNDVTTKWAKMNLGATTIADSPATAYGDYYAWGELDTYYSSKSYSDYETISNITWKSSAKTHVKGRKTGYDWPNYSGSDDFTEWASLPYNDNNIITVDRDVVAQTRDELWRLPTVDDFKNLYAACGHDELSFVPTECTSENDITDKGVYWIGLSENGIKIGSTTYKVPGLLFVPDNTNLDQVIFFPDAGRMDYTNFCGDLGTYWTSSLDSEVSEQAVAMYFQPGSANSCGNFARTYGSSIRPVAGTAPSPKTTGTAAVSESAGISGNKVKWVQLWKDGPKWAEFNVGATALAGYGGYYNWGRTVDQATDDSYSSSTTDIQATSDDTATNLWGANWQMPTQEDLQGLLDNCTLKWTTVYGVQGILFTGKGWYTDNSIFLPAAEFSDHGSIDYSEGSGYYWSSTYNSEKGDPYYLCIYELSQWVWLHNSKHGLSVRPILKEQLGQ